MELIATPAGRFTAEIAGPADGPLVLLLHGFPQSRHSWRDQLAALAAAGYRAVAPDQRGYSPGVRPDPTDLAAYGIDRLVGDVLALADALGAERFHLVGHDWGGQVAWFVAGRHPGRLKSLTTLSRPHPTAFRRAFKEDRDNQRHRSRHHKAFHDPKTAAFLLENDAERLRSVLRDGRVSERTIADYLSVIGDLEALEAALAWYRAAGALADMEVGPVEVPTLYMWGDQDSSVGRAAVEWTAEYVRAHYELMVVPGRGHFLTDEVPALVSTALLAHLAAVER